MVKARCTGAPSISKNYRKWKNPMCLKNFRFSICPNLNFIFKATGKMTK